MSSYIRILTGVAGRAGLCTNSEKCIFKNSQYVKRVFGGGPQLSKFFVQEAGWILSQIHSNFTDAEIVALLDFCGHYHDLLTQDKKFGAKARKFIQNQTAAHKIVMRAQNYADMSKDAATGPAQFPQAEQLQQVWKRKDQHSRPEEKEEPK
jgi:hypothetical protein